MSICLAGLIGSLKAESCQSSTYPRTSIGASRGLSSEEVPCQSCLRRGLRPISATRGEVVQVHPRLVRVDGTPRPKETDLGILGTDGRTDQGFCGASAYGNHLDPELSQQQLLPRRHPGVLNERQRQSRSELRLPWHPGAQRLRRSR